MNFELFYKNFGIDSIADIILFLVSIIFLVFTFILIFHWRKYTVARDIKIKVVEVVYIVVSALFLGLAFFNIN
jgi:hypothetical protein